MYIISPNKLSLFIANRRKALKLSQKEVGERVGLKQQTISAFEKNPEGSRIDTFFRILSAIDLDMDLVPKEKPSDLTTFLSKEQW